MTATAPVPGALRLLGAAMDVYKQVFVAGATAPLLSNPQPVRLTGFDRDVVVEAVEPVAADVVSLTLRAPDGGILPSWRPGAHIELFLPSGRQRRYSLCGNPVDRYRYRIAVRLIPDGDGGSREVHETLRAGSPVRIRGPRNAFGFVDAPSYLFLAGGIGITPILPMARAAGARGRLVYLGSSRDRMPFLDELPNAEIRPDDEVGTPDMAELLALAEPGAAVYVCGPPAMLAAAQRLAFDINPTGSLHVERFAPAPVEGGREFDLTLARTGRTVRVGATETALAAIQRVAPQVPYSCRQGFCGSCETRVLAGAVEHRDRVPAGMSRGDRMRPCVSRAAGDALVLDC